MIGIMKCAVKTWDIGTRSEEIRPWNTQWRTKTFNLGLSLTSRKYVVKNWNLGMCSKNWAFRMRSEKLRPWNAPIENFIGPILHYYEVTNFVLCFSNQRDMEFKNFFISATEIHKRGLIVKGCSVSQKHRERREGRTLSANLWPTAQYCWPCLLGHDKFINHTSPRPLNLIVVVL